MAAERILMNGPNPPRWAEAFLRLLLAPRDRQTVSGDLLEEYRENIYPGRGREAADRWYVSQVVGFALRGNWLWAALLSGSFITRTALDWFVPTADFYMRSTVSTALAATILLCAGFCAAWRSGLLRSGALAGIATTVFAAGISTIGTGCLFAIRHDAATLTAIQGSGGLAEVFTLPIVLVMPGVLLGALGGIVGGIARRSTSG
jgi:hypothetical protein